MRCMGVPVSISCKSKQRIADHRPDIPCIHAECTFISSSGAVGSQRFVLERSKLGLDVFVGVTHPKLETLLQTNPSVTKISQTVRTILKTASNPPQKIGILD